MSDEHAPEAEARDLAVRVVWTAEEAGALNGFVEVRNVSDHVVRVDGKPVIRPLGADGEPLATEHIVTAELRVPSYVDLAPGQLATARIGWGGWDGPPASGEVLVEWGSRSPDQMAGVMVDGPAQPASPGPATNLWSTWFSVVRG